MTVHGNLERAIALAEAAKGNYLLFATESEDDKAQKAFKDMAEDMDRHVQILESRRDYLEKHNPLNGGGGDKEQANDKKQTNETKQKH